MKAKYINDDHTRCVYGDKGACGTPEELIYKGYMPAGTVIEDFETAEEIDDREKREAKAQQSKDKMTGVEFEGVMCSATAKDQFGLASLEGRIRQGMEFNFYFENGNKLMINQSNIGPFEAVWFKFRMSFFE